MNKPDSLHLNEMGNASRMCHDHDHDWRVFYNRLWSGGTVSGTCTAGIQLRTGFHLPSDALSRVPLAACGMLMESRRHAPFLGNSQHPLTFSALMVHHLHPFQLAPSPFYRIETLFG